MTRLQEVEKLIDNNLQLITDYAKRAREITLCGEETMCVVCPYRYCVDEEEMYQRLIEDTKHQVEKWGLKWIHIWFEKEDTIALKAFERYREWLRGYGYEGNQPSYKEWIVHTVDSHKPVRECGCRDGTFYFHKIKE